MEELQHRATNWTSASSFSSFMTKKVNPVESTNFAASFISSGTVSPWVTRPNPLNKPSAQPEEEVPKRKASIEEFVEAVPGKNPWADAKAQTQQLKRKPEVKGGDADGGMNGLYKTELCRSFSETGTCRYGSKCQFAHGIHELMPVQRHPKYKTEVCKSFHTYGTCPYGTRCRFIHSRPGDLPVAQQPAQGWSTSWTKPADDDEDQITPIGAGHKMVAPSMSPVLEPLSPTMKQPITPPLPPVIQISAPVDPPTILPVVAAPVSPIVAPIPAVPIAEPAPAPAHVSMPPAPVPAPVQAPAPAVVPVVVPAVIPAAIPAVVPAQPPIVLRTEGSDLLSLSLQEEELVTATATGEVVIPLNSPQPKKRLPVFQELC